MDVRRQRVHRMEFVKNILKEVSKRDDTINEEKLIAQLQVQWGATRRCVKDYIDSLVISESVCRDKMGKTKILWWNLLKEKDEIEKEADEILNAK